MSATFARHGLAINSMLERGDLPRPVALPAIEADWNSSVMLVLDKGDIVTVSRQDEPVTGTCSRIELVAAAAAFRGQGL